MSMSVVDDANGRADADYLEACVLFVAAELGRPITLAALRSGEAGLRESLSLPDAVSALERAGFVAVVGERRLESLDAALLPAIVATDWGRPVVVVSRPSEGMFGVFDPAFADVIAEVPETELARHQAGPVLLTRRAARDVVVGATDRGGHWFWSALARSKWMYFQVVLAAIMANFLGITTSVFTMVVYDRILPNEAVESLIALTIGVGIALSFDFIIKTVRSYFVDWAGHRADLLLGKAIFDQLLDLQLKVRRGSTGALASTLREFETLREFFTSASLIAIVDIPFILLFLGVIYLIGGPLVLVPAIAVPAVLVVGVVIQPMLARLAENAYKDGQAKQSVLVEAVSGLETIKVVGAARIMRQRWEHSVAQQSEHALKSRAVTQFALNATAFAQQAAQVMIVFYGVFLVQAGIVSMGALIASVMLTGRALAPLAQLAQTLTRLNQARMSYRSIDRLMRDDREQAGDRTWLSRPKLDGAVSFRDVAFAYPDQQAESLKSVSFEIAPGERVAILGRIGSGKSTIARLMLGLYAPIRGSVLFDGTDVRQIDPADLRRNIGSALQDVWLFTGTIRENIAVGADRPRDADILRAATIAGVDDFVRSHPMGYDRVLSERGEGLSGGQKQAIAVARALVGTPSILLLDEPTSSMDVQSEQRFMSRLKAEMQDRTLVIVTHRTSMLELVDRVIVIEDGRVVLDGPKAALARRAAVGVAKDGADDDRA